MPDPRILPITGPIAPPSITDLPAGWGPGMVPESERLQSPALGEGASRVGYNDTAPILGADNVQDAIDALKGGSGGAAAFVATNEFWVDTTVVDSPANATLRMFSLIELALEDINNGALGAGEAFVLRCREGQTHVWDGTNYLNDRSGTIYAEGGINATTLGVAAGLTLAGAGAFSLLIKNMVVDGEGLGGINATGDTVLQFEDCTLSQLVGNVVWTMEVSGRSTLDTCDFGIVVGLSVRPGATVTACTFACPAGEVEGVYVATDVQHTDTTWNSDGGSGLVVTITGGTVRNTLTDGSFVFGGIGADLVTLALTGATVTLDLTSVVEDPSFFCQGVSATLADVSIIANLTDAAASLYLFRNPGAGTTASLNDVRLSYNGPGAIDYEQNGVITTNNGFVVLGAALLSQPDGTFYNDGTGYVVVAPNGGSGTPPTIVQTKASTNGSDSLTLDAAPTNGNLLVAMSFNPLVQTAGPGWTLQFLQGSGLDYGFILTKVAGGAEPALQTPLPSAPGTGALMIWELSGQAATFFVAAAGQVEQAGPIVVGPQLPNVANAIALHGMGSVDTVDASYNAIQDVLDNTGTRKAYAGHSFAPGVAQLIGRVASTGGYKVASCLITS